MNGTREWSTRQIMNTFDVTALAWILHEMSTAEIGFLFRRLTGQAAAAPGEPERSKATKALEYGEILFKHSDLGDAFRALMIAKESWERPILDNSAASEIMHRLQVDIIESLKNCNFLRIADDRLNLIDQDKLFGDAVNDRFVSAHLDIKEAGNCLAAECSTACVFHLMRASEVGLRTLAKDRQIVFADKPLDQKEWGQILGKLEEVVKSMRLANGNQWKEPRFREAQIRFYNEVVQELRGFNEAWRRHVSHARADAFYDRNDASDIMKHVRKFMQKLATRISENKITLLYWETE
jgi:hypothetical protein